MAQRLGSRPMASVGSLTDVDTSARNALGTRVMGVDDFGGTAEYIYLTGVASLAAGDWVVISQVSGAQAAVRLPTTATNGMLAVALAAPTASQFGWFQIYGVTPSFTAIATDASADGKLVSAGSATGRVATGATTTKNIFGAVCVGASASNTGRAFISYPFEFGSATI